MALTVFSTVHNRHFYKGRIDPPNLEHRHRLSEERHRAALSRLPRATDPSFDCRAQGWVGPIKDQGMCGSCWDFSGTGVCESAFFKAGLQKPDGTFQLSEQYILDCTSNGGCNGDDNTTVLDACKGKGQPTTQDYGAYLTQAAQCHLQPAFKLYQIPDWGYVGPQQGVADTQAIKDAMKAYGPIGCAVAADDTFSNYSGGVFNGSGSTAIDHDIILAGWDDAKGAWLLRNSWGTSWGESGYMWIKYGANLVGTEAVFAKTPAGPGPTPVPPGPTPPPGPVPPPTPPPCPCCNGMDLIITGTLATLFGHEAITLTGKATPAPAKHAVRDVEAVKALVIQASGVIPWVTLLGWIVTYGLPLVLQILPLILSGGWKGLTVQQLIAWGEAALAALASGQPLPPLPVPGV